MKIPSGLAPRYSLYAVAILGLAVLQACCEFPGNSSTAPYAFQFHYTQPMLINPKQAERLLEILIKHKVTGTLTLNGVPVSRPSKKIETDGVTMAQQTSGHPKPSGNWRTQLVGLLEADKKKNLKAALKEIADSVGTGADTP